ncbi:hypothetical protein BD413DRAFT_39137 [Trametes elegans]|nr:hypothetical protein BD413DRAFT_39137 [Trametes elegans]
MGRALIPANSGFARASESRNVSLPLHANFARWRASTRGRPALDGLNIDFVPPTQSPQCSASMHSIPGQSRHVPQTMEISSTDSSDQLRTRPAVFGSHSRHSTIPVGNSRGHRHSDAPVLPGTLPYPACRYAHREEHTSRLAAEANGKKIFRTPVLPTLVRRRQGLRCAS